MRVTKFKNYYIPSLIIYGQIMSYSKYLSHSVDLFSKPMKEVGFVKGFDHIIRPQTLLNDSVEFKLDPDDVNYLKTDQTFIYCKFKIVDNEGKDLENTVKVAPINYFPAALFESCEIFCNDIRISGASHNSLPYKRYIETLLSYGLDARNSHLKLAMFEMDSVNNFDNSDDNLGHKERKTWVQGSKDCEFLYWLQNDILNVDRYYPSGMKLRFMFHKSASDWCLMEDNLTEAEKTARKAEFKFNIKILDMSLNIRKVTPEQSLVTEHKQRFSKNQTALYPYTRGVVKKFTVLQGQTAVYLPSMLTGKLPTQVFMVMNETEADLGSLSKNPFKFQHFNMSRAALTIDGQLRKEYNCDFDNNNYIDVLAELYRNIGIHNSNSGTVIDKDYFKNGCAIVSWNLTPDKSSYMPFTQGTIDIDVTYSTALEKGVTIIILCLFDDILQIDAGRNIIVV